MQYKLTAIDETEKQITEGVSVFLSNISDTLVVRLPKGIAEVEAAALYQQLQVLFAESKKPVLVIPGEVEFLRLEACDVEILP